ncbi:hypothetical protein NRY95_08120 [Xanthomonas campestris pv. phormiicola]|nr:hypothetical protein [Xanthomonas campestris pv. phormiicola]UYC17906.1 hypothetical protein NRY95_08120 [Xanthomonas campestris pv. phormiicola]
MLISIGMRNIAPSADDPLHDVYEVLIDPAAARPLCLAQSIHGGHADRGGAVFLGLDELDAWAGDWRLHLRHADCAWAIAPIEAAQRGGDAQAVLAQLIAEADARRPARTPQR